ncbi:MAG: 1-acyl-sn-glycerol-3-phosphate acyltransferase [Bacteroidales bacterium]|nr:1-acyl-sn-glycerol-3-phosphate acyltransferase [Bacteroidales bacterium]
MAKFCYWTFRGYLRFVHDKLYYRKTYVVNKENATPDGVPTLVASNHQNALNDPLAVQFSFKRRFVSIFARADVLQIPVAGKILKALGLIPAFRLAHEGEEALKQNFPIFEEAGSRLIHGHTIAIFPEATNQDRHWLGDFSLGYLRLAFQAAERDGFKTDIKILPTALHYDNYFSMQSSVVVKYGTAVSLADYYELYQTKPRTAQRKVNEIVRKQISDMMLNINDTENYEAIDYIRTTYGVRWAQQCGIDPKYLPSRLDTDKELCAALENLSATQPEVAKQIFADALELKKITLEVGTRDWVFDKKVTANLVFWRCFGLAVTLPLFIISLWPAYFVFKSPNPLTKKFEAKGGNAKMFIGGARYVICALVSIPLFWVIAYLLDLSLFNWWIALIHCALLPVLSIFAWNYRIYCIKSKGWIRYLKAKNKNEKFRSWITRREQLFNQIENIVKTYQSDKKV